jgi:amino acid transporter
MVHEQTPLLDATGDASNAHTNGSSSTNGTSIPYWRSSASDDEEGSHHLPDIPEGEQALLGRYDSDDDDGSHSCPPESTLHNLDLLSEVPLTPSTRSRRTYSIDSVLEDAAELLHNVTDIVSETVVEVKEEIVEIFEEEVLPVKPREEGDHSQKLSAIALAVLVFYKVSGGPFGCEPAVKAAGPFFALLGFTVFPLLWCLQEALITAELGSAYPEPSGAVAWIEEAFGPKAGLVCGYFHWVAGATDNAIYPSLFLQYLSQYMTAPGEDSLLTSGPVRFLFTILISAGLAFINYCGLEIVGTLSIVVCIISMSPFLILCIIGLPQVDPSRWFVMPSNVTELSLFLDDDALNADTILPSITYAGVMWRPFVNALFWNLNSFDVGASFAGEVQDPERVFPKAMFLAVLFVVLGYIIPLLISIGASTAHQSEWNAGFFTKVAGEIAGPWLAAWMVLAAAVSNIGLFEAEMSGDAYQLMGMADRGLIPKYFCRRSRFGTPTNGILVGTFVIFCLGVANFDALVEMLNFAYSIALLMEFSAFIKLRITDGDGMLL